TLVYIKSEGDIDLHTPLYEMGVQGVFTRSLDAALLSGKIDIAVHSMKDVPTQLAKGIQQAAVLKRASPFDILVYKKDISFLENAGSAATIATSSIRRKAQWLNKYPAHNLVNLRGNVNTRLKKLDDSDWQGAIFAAAGLERINLRPANSIELDWMLPAPAQGAIMVVCRQEDEVSFRSAGLLNDADTAACVKVERDFLRTLLGGCSTPISAYATIEGDKMNFQGNILSLDGKLKKEVESIIPVSEAKDLGINMALQLLKEGGQAIADSIRNAGK
ncbi:MAG TPA: hydroxymethylbilane synthase, partial [Allocoleopsis sp.]